MTNFEKIREAWRWIPGFEGRYKVSTNGKVMSFCTRTEGRVLKPNIACERVKYHYVCLRNHGKYYNRSIHRLVATVFIENPDNKPYVCHINGNSFDNRVDNLKWGTPKENNFDKIAHGTYQYGEKNPGVKLNNDIVSKIKSMYKEGIRICEISKYLKVNANTVKNITSGRDWKHIMA